MAAKKKKTPKKAKRPRASHSAPRHPAHPHAGQPKPRPRRSKKKRPFAHAQCRGPRGLAAHAHAENPAYEENPSGSELLERALRSVFFGSAAAAAGVLGSLLIAKAGVKSAAGNVAINAATGAVLGGALGMADHAAGTIVAHNYLVAASHLLGHRAPSSESRATPLALHHAPTPGGATRLLSAGAMHGPDEMGAYERLDGVVADNMGATDDMGGYERLDGVVADNMGATDDMGGYERLDGVVADNMGATDELGAIEAVDELGDDFGDSDELRGADDFGDADPF